MSDIERHLETVRDKHEMHRIIDALPDGAVAVLAVTRFGDDGNAAAHWLFGDETLRMWDVLGCIELTKARILVNWQKQNEAAE